jgi:hypothetical protein
MTSDTIGLVIHFSLSLFITVLQYIDIKQYKL